MTKRPAPSWPRASRPSRFCPRSWRSRSGRCARQGDDASEAASLAAAPKEHAERAMVTDLMRNDLSRVAEPGSVTVHELMAVLPFAGLSHLVSTVTGTARAGLSLEALLLGTF